MQDTVPTSKEKSPLKDNLKSATSLQKRMFFGGFSFVLTTESVCVKVSLLEKYTDGL